MYRPTRFALSAMGFVCLLLVSLPFFSLRSVWGQSMPSDPLDPIYYPSINTDAIPANVWVTGALAKVQPDATPGALQLVRISAARNEFESFQIHVRAETNPIQLSVTVSDFVNAQTGDVIASATNVLVYREAYLNITQLSDANGVLGLTPDPLIPTKDPYFNEARNAFPVTVPVNEVRSAWIDVLVPDAARSGYYLATVTVSDGASVLAAVPAVLKLWDFAIPSTATLRSAFGISWNGLCIQAYQGYANCGQYPSSGGSPDRAIELTHLSQATFALDHRVSISESVYYGPPVGDWAHFDAAYGPLLNGSARTLLFGAKLTNLQYWGPGYQIVASDVQDWVTHFSSSGWLGALFQYTCDEPPNGCSWDQALALAQSVHSASSSMKTLITTDLASATQYNLLDELNILAPTVNAMDPQGGTNQRSTYDAWLSGQNKHLWWYQACSTHESCTNGTAGPPTSTWPSYMVDATPVRNRVFQWLAFLNRIEAELYYQVDYCWTASDCASTDPWISVYAFGGNGDGTLIYPGTATRIGGNTPVPVSSIRLKLIRDGFEDFEYLNALSNAGEDSLARSIAATFITNSYTFNNDPQAMTDAREALGNELHRLAIINTPTLQVSPTSDISVSGNPGGPFLPASFPYQLSASTGSVNYSISGVPSWLTASPSTSGTVTTSPITITFTVNSTANSLSPATYNATIMFTDTTNNTTTQTIIAALAVNVPPNTLVVSPPTNMSYSGNQGGPFAPSSFQYQLSATSGSISYSISGLPVWLNASSASGTATTSATSITFTVNSSANSLVIGTYSATISFANTSNGQGNQTRSATLQVNYGGVGSSYGSSGRRRRL